MRLRFERAFAAHQAGDLAAARAGYQAVLKAQPRHFDALHMLGVAALQARDFAEAATLIEQALAVHQGYALAWLNLAGAYRGLGRPGDAADCLLRNIALAGADAAKLETLADLCLAAGRPREAARTLRAAAGGDAGHADAAVGLGIALRELGHAHEALQNFERALAIAPAHARAANNIGITLCEQQRYAEALAQFDRLLAREPAYAPAHNARALALWKLGRLDEAEQAYDRAIELDPGYADAYSNRGALLATRGRDDAALRDYTRAIALEPRRAEAHNCLGALLASQHRTRRGNRALPRGHRLPARLRAGAQQPRRRAGRGGAAAGRPGELQPGHRAAASRTTRTRADALANRAGLWAQLRHYAEAAADARAALAIDPHLPTRSATRCTSS